MPKLTAQLREDGREGKEIKIPNTGRSRLCFQLVKMELMRKSLKFLLKSVNLL